VDQAPVGQASSHAVVGHSALTGVRRPSRRVVQGAGVVGFGLLAGCGRRPWQAQPPKLVSVHLPREETHRRACPVRRETLYQRHG
jgi:hypothetical protein